MNPGGFGRLKLLFTDWTAVSHLTDGPPAGQTGRQRDRRRLQEEGLALAATPAPGGWLGQSHHHVMGFFLLLFSNNQTADGGNCFLLAEVRGQSVKK